jgi:hypothetical protein
MGVRVGELDPRQMERLRGELAEVLAAECAYPPYFDYPTNRRRTRPIDRQQRDEIEQFLRSTNFTQLQAADIASPEVRRFIERLLLRYLEVNSALGHAHVKRRLPDMRARMPKVAGELQRGLKAHVEGSAPSFGAHRQQPTWAGSAGKRHEEQERLAHNTRVLEAILLRPAPAESHLAKSHTAPGAGMLPALQAEAYREAANGASRREEYTDATIPVPAQGWHPPEVTSPFAGLASGAQSAIFGASEGLTEQPTGPLPASAARGASPQMPANGRAAREISPELFQIYGDYLRDMQPEAFRQQESAPHTSASAPRGFPAVEQRTEPPTFATSAPERPARGADSTPPWSANPRGDALIFWQLRYQLDAYIKRAVKSYGVQVRSEDPSSAMDALRRSGFVDEADLRIAESILAITDRVTASGSASVEDYREALMLYLLYHRSHLGT